MSSETRSVSEITHIQRLQPWTRALLVMLDFETTGISIATDEPVQIAWCGLHVRGRATERVVETFQSLLRCTGQVSKQATAVHGITTTDLVADTVPSFGAVWERAMLPWLKRNRRDDEVVVLVGHNLKAFDLPLLGAALVRHKIVGDADSKTLAAFYEKLHIVACFDTLQWARTKLGLPGNTLTAVYEYMTRKTLKGAHTALVDVLATREIVEAANLSWDAFMTVPILPCLKRSAATAATVTTSSKPQPTGASALTTAKSVPPSTASRPVTCKCGSVVSPHFSAMSHKCAVIVPQPTAMEVAFRRFRTAMEGVQSLVMDVL